MPTTPRLALICLAIASTACAGTADAPTWLRNAQAEFEAAYAVVDATRLRLLFTEAGALAVPPHAAGAWVANADAGSMLAALARTGYPLQLSTTDVLGPRVSKQANTTQVYHSLGVNTRDGASFYLRWEKPAAAGAAGWRIAALVADAAGLAAPAAASTETPIPTWMKAKYMAMRDVWNMKDYDAFTGYFAADVVTTKALTTGFLDGRTAFKGYFVEHGSVHCDDVVALHAQVDGGAYNVIAACLVGDAAYPIYDRWAQKGADWEVEFEVMGLASP